MSKFRKKPVVIEAEVYRPGLEDGFGYRVPEGVGFLWDGFGNLADPGDDRERVPVIRTLEGYMVISPGDYIVTGVRGERYPCKPDIFEVTYERVLEPAPQHAADCASRDGPPPGPCNCGVGEPA